ncbi:hypothetical protein IWW54_004614 [Coemansia sp. RSA 2705]|nr:hypothetical protein IWW54_004614 [Coemansia sp. RSA 2705]
MKLLGCTALGILSLASVHASFEAPIQGPDDFGAASEAASNAPSPAGAAEHICPECMVRLLLPPGESGLDAQQEAAVSAQLAAEVSRLVDEAAVALNKPHNQIFSNLQAVVRARGRSWPRFSASALMGSEYAEEGRRFFDRMMQLLRKFIAAYVTAVAENGLESSAQTAASSETHNKEGASPLASTTASATAPLSAAEIETPSTTQHATTSAASRKSRSKSHSRSDDDDNDDDEDDNGDGDEEEGDDDERTERRGQPHASSSAIG